MADKPFDPLAGAVSPAGTSNMADDRKPSALKGMVPLDVIAIAEGAPGYAHLRSEAEEEVARDPKHYDKRNWQKAPRYEMEAQTNYAKGGIVKHGSSTRVTCRSK